MIENLIADPITYTVAASQNKAPHQDKQAEIFAHEGVQEAKTTSHNKFKSINPTSYDNTTFGVLTQSQEKYTTDPSIRYMTSNGHQIDLDEKYTNDPKPVYVDLKDHAKTLTLPTRENLEAISTHLNARLKEMIADYDIPEMPSTIKYNAHGEMVLPADYPYKDQLIKALEANPGIERELSSLHAISSQYAELLKLAPLHEEASKAKTQAELDAIFLKYSHLLGDNRRPSNIALTFDEDINLGITADGKDLI